MITNRYYITTIIAIFLSLSLGILIGGTLGQQWLNDNQQKLMAHYESKADKLEDKNKELLITNKELNGNYLRLQEDFRLLFTSSIKNEIGEMKILWINDTDKTYDTLRSAIEIAGGKIQEFKEEHYAISQPFDEKSQQFVYDAILFFPSVKEVHPNYKWLHQLGIPIIYVTENDEYTITKENDGMEIYEKTININSFNEQYEFVHFLKFLLQEKKK